MAEFLLEKQDTANFGTATQTPEDIDKQRFLAERRRQQEMGWGEATWEFASGLASGLYDYAMEEIPEFLNGKSLTMGMLGLGDKEGDFEDAWGTIGRSAELGARDTYNTFKVLVGNVKDYFNSELSEEERGERAWYRHQYEMNYFNDAREKFIDASTSQYGNKLSFLADFTDATNLIPSVGALKFLPKATRSALKGSAELSGKALSRTGAGLMGVSDIAGYPRSLAKKYKLGEIYGAGQALGVAGTLGGATGVAGTISTGMTGLLATNIVAKIAGKLAMEVGEVAKIFAMPSSHARFLHRLATSDAVSKKTRKTATMLNSMKGTQAYDILFNSFVAGLGAGAMQIGIEGAKGKGAYDVGVATGQGIGMGSGVGLGISATGAGERGAGKTLNSRNPDGTLSERSLQGMENYLAKKKQANNIEQIKAFGALDDTSKIAVSTLDELAGLGNFRMELVDDQEATRIILESENSDSKIEIPEGTKLGAIPSAFYDPKSRSVFIHDKQVKEGSKIGARLFLHEFGHHAFREMLGSSPMSRRQILANYEQEDGYEFEYFDDGGKLMGSVKVNEEAFNFAKDYADKIRSTSPAQAEKLGFDEDGNWRGRGDAKLLSEELGAEQWSMAYQYEPNAFEGMNKGIRHTLIDAMKTGLAKLGVVEPDSGNPAKSMISEAMTASPEVKKVLDNYVQKRKQHLADRANDIDTGRKHTPDKSNGQTSDEKYTSLFGGIGINKAMGRHFHIQDEEMFNELLETLIFDEENAGDFTGIGKGNEGRQLHWKTREMFGRAGKYNSAVKEVIDFIQEAINNREMIQFGYRSANWFKASDYNAFFERSITPYAWQISPKKPRFSLRHGRTIYPNLKVMGWDADIVENNIEIMNSAGLLGGRKVEDFKKDFAEHAQSVLTESGKEGRINPLGLGENELFTMAFGMRDSGLKIQNPELNEWFSSEANTMKQALKSYDVSALAGISGEGKSGYAYDYKNVKHNYMPSIAQNGFENSTIPPRTKRYSLSRVGSTFVTLPEEYNRYTDEELDLIIRDPDSDYYRDEENLRLNESLMEFGLNPVESQLGKIDRLGTFLVGATRQNPEIFAHEKQTLSMDMPDLETGDLAEYHEALVEELESMLRTNLAKYDDLEIGFQDATPDYSNGFSVNYNVTFSDRKLRDKNDFKELTLSIDVADKTIGFDTSHLGNLAGDNGGNSTNSYFSGKAIYQALYDFADGAGLEVVHTSLTRVNQLRTISTRLSQLLKSESDRHITETGRGTANVKMDMELQNGLAVDDIQVIPGVEGYEGGTTEAVAQELIENDPSRFEFLKMMGGIESPTDVLDAVPFAEGYGKVIFAHDDAPHDGFIRRVTAYARQELREVRKRMQQSDWKDVGVKKEDVLLEGRDKSIFKDDHFNQLDAFRYDFDSGEFIFTEYRKNRENSLGLDYVIGGDGVQHPWFASDKRNPNTNGFRSFLRNHRELIYQGVGESTLKRAIIANTIARATDAKTSLKPFSDRPKFVQKTLGKKLFFMPEGYQSIDNYSYGETQLLQGDSEFANKIASRYKNEPIHVGRYEVINSINQEQAPIEEFEERGVANKPYGLWFARGDGWMQFIDRNHFGIIGKQAHKLNLNTSEIAQVNKNTIKDFEKKYLVGKDFFNDLSPIYGDGVIDWKKVAEDYSGVEVNLESFGESRPKWLTGWDITSGALWNDKALNGTSHLQRVNGELNFMPETKHKPTKFVNKKQGKQKKVLKDLYYMPYVALTDETAQQFDRVIADMKANPWGFTIDQSNELHAKSGYVVAPEKETEFVVPLKEMTRTELWSYIRDHAHRFKKEGAHLGGWIKDDTQFMLDVAFPVENYLDAVRMAIWGDQDSIYDINTGTEIKTKNEDKSEQILPPHFPISIEKIKQARPENLLAFADARNRDKGRIRHESFTADSRANLTDEEVANLPIMDSLQFMPSVPTETFSKETAMGFPMLSYENPQKKIELPNRVIPKTESLTKNSANWDERKWNAYFEDNRVADGLMRQMANNATPEAYALITQIRLNRVGSFDIPAPPTKLLDYVNNPQLLIDWLDRTMANNPEQINLAKQGVASAKQMYNVKKTPEMVSQAFIWGLLSRMLDPYNQEAGWLRLTNNKKMWQAIFDSIDGKYSMDKGTFWDAQKIGDEKYGWRKMPSYKKSKNKDAFIKKKMSKLSKKMRAGFAKEANDRNLNRQKGTFVDIVANMFEDQKNEVVAGNNAKQNIQAIHDMLVKWNGRWAELTDLFNDKSLDGQGIREKMWATGFLGAGVKDKVTSFVIALMADPNVVIMDRWQFVNVWEHQIQDSVRNRQKKVNSILAPNSGASKADIKLAKEQAKEFNKWGVSPYRYDESGTPEDRSGFYKTIGSTLDNPVEHALYRTLEFYFGELAQKVSKMNPQYAWIDSAFAMHWVTWNMIKQEAVGHSSFDVLTEMAQNGQFPMSASARQIFVDDFIKKPKYTERNERVPKENKTKRTRFFQDAKGQPIEEIREREKDRAGLGYRIKGKESVYFKGLPPE